MKFFLLASLVVLAAARSQDEPQYKTLEDAGILRMESTMNEDGSFQYGFETNDPIQQDVAGQIKQIGEKVGVVMQGSYSYTTEDAYGELKTITIDWVADENGFQPRGDAIPVVAPEDPNAAAQAAASDGLTPESPTATRVATRYATRLASPSSLV